MYQPKLARFMSRDPLPAHGVDIFYPVPDMRKFVRSSAYDQPYVYANSSPINFSDPSGLQAVRCFAEHCTTAGPHNFSEGTIYFRAEVIGEACGQPGAVVRFYLTDSKWLGPGKMTVGKNGQPTPCGYPANDELDAILPRPGFRYGDILSRGCNAPSNGGSFRFGKDKHGCWTLEWSWECPLNCIDNECQPRSSQLGIYGPGTPDQYGISSFSLQTSAKIDFDSTCCGINSCSISLALDWESFEKLEVGPPPNFELIRRRIPTPNDCTPEELNRAKNPQISR